MMDIRFASKRLLMAICLCFDDMSTPDDPGFDLQKRTISESNATLARRVVSRIINGLQNNPRLKYAVELALVSNTRQGEFNPVDKRARTQYETIKRAYDMIIDRSNQLFDCDVAIYVPSIVLIISDGTNTNASKEINTLDKQADADSFRDEVYATMKKHYDPELKLSEDFIVPITIKIGKENRQVLENGKDVNPFEEIEIEDIQDMDQFSLLDNLPYFHAHSAQGVTRKLLLDEFSDCIADCCQRILSSDHRKASRTIDMIHKNMKDLLAELSEEKQ